ncbi:hypothetical protein SKAU_G00290910 [Synaphobranchus kaupii]|uniref:Uncharacterized protein n=1 Tax=Synaphobranchus kaupii TaxID=118154 RepID=A0A9Q1ETT1_SYNKA|nr:hypothetical protein SKAU_G00290910 [Synaphobranchus kaupii]
MLLIPLTLKGHVLREHPTQQQQPQGLMGQTRQMGREGRFWFLRPVPGSNGPRRPAFLHALQRPVRKTGRSNARTIQYNCHPSRSESFKGQISARKEKCRRNS